MSNQDQGCHSHACSYVCVIWWLFYMFRRATLASGWRALSQVECDGWTMQNVWGRWTRLKMYLYHNIVVRSCNDCRGNATMLSLCIVIDLHVAFSWVKPSSFALETQGCLFALLSKRQIRVISTAVYNPEVLTSSCYVSGIVVRF